ncbi:hypothetical protein Hanom_Chr06g00576891 [Helianthus anomalus]
MVNITEIPHPLCRQQGFFFFFFESNAIFVPALRFGQFCDFCPKVCFFASASKKFKILPFTSSSLTASIFSVKSGVFPSFSLYVK